MTKHPHDWLNGRDERIVDAWIEFFVENNLYFKRQAEQYNILFFDIAEHGYDGTMRNALDELLRR